MNQSVLNTFDNRALLNLDPLVSKGYVLITSKSLNSAVRMQQSKDGNQQIQFLMKIYVKSNKQTVLHVIIDLLTEQDLFYHYRCSIDPAKFKQLDQQHQLNSTFNKFPKILMDLLQDIQKREIFMMVDIESKQQIVISFHQEINYKQIKLFQFIANRPEKSICFQLIAYRYQFLKTEINNMNGRLKDVRALLLNKNPQLLMKLNKEI